MFTILGLVITIFFLLILPVLFAYFGCLESEIYIILSSALHSMLGFVCLIVGIIHNNQIVFLSILNVASIFIINFEWTDLSCDYDSPHEFVLKGIAFIKERFGLNGKG